jgi:two-component system sensor histidine kinase/response regulator
MKTSRPPATILVVEDDPLIREVAAEILRKEGYRVVAVEDGAAALEELPTVRPELILSDVRMPRCDGFELLRQVRRDPAFRHTPFIIISAKAEASDQRMGMSLGADDYVTKPFLGVDLLKTIELRLAGAALLSETLHQQQRFLTRVLPHELRTPLAGIIGYADLMVLMGESGDTLTAKDLVDYGQSIGRSGMRLLRMAQDLTLWAFLESASSSLKTSGRDELRKTQVTAEALRQWGQKCTSKYGRECDLSIEAQSVTVMVPEDSLDCVFEHLVENALKFSLPGSGIMVKMVLSERACEIRVTDHGRGMSEADLEAIGAMRQFERDKFEQQGLGMGLALARVFARVSGGEFTLTRNVETSGMTAVLKLQRAAAD